MPGTKAGHFCFWVVQQARRATVMLHRNSGKKSSNSKALMLLKCHGSVAMIRLCDGLQSWFISSGAEAMQHNLQAFKPAAGKPGRKKQSVGALFVEALSPVPELGCGCCRHGAAWAVGRAGRGFFRTFGPTSEFWHHP
jgi:hypothetical protein